MLRELDDRSISLRLDRLRHRRTCISFDQMSEENSDSNEQLFGRIEFSHRKKDLGARSKEPALLTRSFRITTRSIPSLSATKIIHVDKRCPPSRCSAGYLLICYLPVWDTHLPRCDAHTESVGSNKNSEYRIRFK